MTFTVTPAGVLAHIPLVDLHTDSGLAFADFGISVEGYRLLLVLLRRPHTPPRSHPAYHVGARNLLNQEVRLIRVEAKESLNLDDWPLASTWDASWTWSDVYLLHNVPSSSHRRLGVPLVPVNHSLHPSFRFPDENIHAFTESLFSGSRFFKRVQLSVKNVQVPTREALPASFVFAKGHKAQVQNRHQFAIVISVGQCELSSMNDIQPVGVHVLRPLLWAHVRCYDEDPDVDTTHHCGHDHVAAWPSMKRIFACGGYRGQWKSLEVTLSFTPCPLNPSGTLILSASAEVDLDRTFGETPQVDGELHVGHGQHEPVTRRCDCVRPRHAIRDTDDSASHYCRSRSFTI